jgi:uncharacterized protein
VPAKLRKRFGIEEGSLVTAEEGEDGILIRPASEEARINLIDDVQRPRLAKLLERIELCDAPGRELPPAISLPEKDVPIIRAAIEARATHLLTGDVRHFGPYFGNNVGGVLISLPGEYLREQSRA